MEHLATAMSRQNPHQAILSDARKESQNTHELQGNVCPVAQRSGETADITQHVTSEVGTIQSKAPTPMHTYTCPFCHQTCHSIVHTGKINHRNYCGKQFMVQNGLVAGRTHQHPCPKCGVVVNAAKESGRIQVKHKNGNGRMCPCESWNVTAP